MAKEPYVECPCCVADSRGEGPYTDECLAEYPPDDDTTPAPTVAETSWDLT